MINIIFPKIPILSIFLIFFHCLSFAQDNEPSSDLTAESQAAEGFSIEDIETINLYTGFHKPNIDGIIDEGFWFLAEPLAIDYEFYPQRFTKALVQTKAYLAVTETHLYVAFYAYDPDIKKIRSTRRARDGSKDDDYVSLVIDPSGSLRRKLEFRVNPHGSISDVLQNTISDKWVYDWDTQWRAAAKIHDDGYSVEIEIPLKSLKYEETASLDKMAVWPIMLKRTFPRKVDHTLGSIYKIQLMEKPLPFEPEVRLSPHYIYHQDEERDAGESFKQVPEHNEHSVGLDFKWAISNTSSLSGTIKPNYTDVEIDIARESINNSFNVFKPEKRKFFQEDMDLYLTLMPLIYTRNIVRPDFGLKYGLEKGHDSIGGFVVQDQELTFIMPDSLGSEKVETTLTSQSSAARYVTSEKGSGWGLLGTHRSADNYHNTVASVDGIWNISLDDKLRYQFAFSDTQYPNEVLADLCDADSVEGCRQLESTPCLLGQCDTNAYVLRANNLKSFSDHSFRIDYRHDSPDSLYWVKYFEVAPDFRSDMGYVRRTDYRMVNAAYGRNWFFRFLKRDEGPSRGRVYLLTQQVQSQSKGDQLEETYAIWSEFRGSYQSVLRLGFQRKNRVVNRYNQSVLDIAGNAPTLDEQYWQWYFETSPNTYVTFNLDGRKGDIADVDNNRAGDMLELKPRVRLTWNNWTLNFQHTYRNMEISAGNVFTENYFTTQIYYRPDNQHTFRLAYLDDRVNLNDDLYFSDETEREVEDQLEFTYAYKPYKKLTLLSGAKYTHEEETGVKNTLTEKQIYLKLIYNFDMKL
jgi:hypothetical protein